MEWTLPKLNELIALKAEESTELEYKAAGALGKDDAKKKEISKDVSGMANANGGVIIYGIQEDPADKRKPLRVDPINPSDYSKEWLENVIHSNIRPRIPNLIIHSIDVPGGVVYIIELQQSNRAHQASNFIYYKRKNFKTDPMEDYEIKDIMNRQIHPELKLWLQIERRCVTPNPEDPRYFSKSYNNQARIFIRIREDYEDPGDLPAILYVYFQNIGTKKAHDAKFCMRVPEGILINEENYERQAGDKILVHGEMTKPLVCNSKSLADKYYINPEHIGKDINIDYILNVDDAPQRELKISWKDIETTISERVAGLKHIVNLNIFKDTIK